jgi:predicted nuclease with TOPRIM domain
MKNKLEQRLQELKSEFESGQKMVLDLEGQQANLKTTLLRISGAIQVLEELLSPDREPTENNDRVLETVGALNPINL